MPVDADLNRSAERLTFLLTDVEGSTRRWEADPDHMAELLVAHDVAIESEVSKAGGALIKARGEGDSTFAVFPDPPAALQAAVACQFRLLGDVGLPVRMAIHTGETHQRWGDYYGPPVNRAARLRSLAAGGRVLLSSITADGVAARLPAGCRLVDLGLFVLRDLEHPERIFGVHHPDLPAVLSPQYSAVGLGLVGRDAELAATRALAADADRSRTRIAVVVGAGGIGKTRLAEVAGREVCASGGRLVWVTAHGDLSAPPFSLWTDLLARLPERGGLASLPGQPGDQVLDREALYEQIRGGIRASAQDSLLVIVLDDLQRADRSSLELLRRLATEHDLGRLLLLVLSRPAPPNHPTRQVVAEVGRARHATVIDLVELSEAEGARLVAGIAPQLDRGTIDEVVQHAGGNPLYLRAYATTVTRPGVTAMPDTVRAAIAEGLAELEPGAARVLEVAAVAGRSIAVDVIGAAAAVDESEVLRSLAAAESVGLVTQASVVVPSWRFTHDIVRDAIVTGVDPASRAAVHGRVGQAIERLRDANVAAHAAEIATHYFRATAEYRTRAVSYSELAARAALRAGAFEQAAGHCRRALGQLAGIGSDSSQRARLLIMLGAALHADDLEAAAKPILDAIAIARSIRDQRLLTTAVQALPPDTGRLDIRAVAELHAVIETIGDEDPTIAARLHGHLALHHFTARHWDDLGREADAAWRLSRSVGDPDARFLGSVGRLLTRWCDRDDDTSRAVLSEATWSAEAAADPKLKLLGRYMRARPLIEFADRNGFRATIELVEEGVNGQVPAYSQWIAATWRTLEALLDGELERAGDLLERSQQLGQGRSQIALAGRFHQRSLLRLEQDRLAEELDAIKSFAQVWPGHPVIVGWQALALAEAGQDRQAQALLAAVDDDGFDKVPAPLCFALAPLTETAVKLGAGDLSTRLAQALAPRAGYLFVGFGFASTCYGAVDRYLGLSAALAGDYEAALGHHAAATRLHWRFGSRLWLLHSRLDTAAALAGRAAPGDLAEARALAAAALQESARTPLARVQQRAADLLHQLAQPI
jgi:class 3 adenylate cyclase